MDINIAKWALTWIGGICIGLVIGAKYSEVIKHGF